MAVKVEITEYGEREWVSADAMDRQVQLRLAADQQRDRLLEAVKGMRASEWRGNPHPKTIDALYDTAAAIESEVGKS